MGKFSDRFLRVVDQICTTDLDYPKEAYFFVYDALGFASRALDLEPDQHLSGNELIGCGVIPLAFKRWGFLSEKVLNHWNIFCSKDVGKIVRNFVNVGVFNKDATDNWESFSEINLERELKRFPAADY